MTVVWIAAAGYAGLALVTAALAARNIARRDDELVDVLFAGMVGLAFGLVWPVTVLAAGLGWLGRLTSS